MPLRETVQKNKKWIVIGAIVVVAIGGYLYYTEGRTVAPKLTTGAVRKGDINSSVAATGTINPLTTAAVGSYVSGTVQYIFADFNTKVSAGQVLTQLDPAIYEAQVTTAQGNLENAKANLVTLAANVDVDQANLAKAQANATYEVATAKRSQDLFTSGIVSTDSNDLIQSSLGQANADVQSQVAAVAQAKAQLAQAKSQVVSMDGALKQAQTNLKYTTIVSPIAGTVVARNVDVGQSVAAALSAPNVFSVAQDLTRMQVYAATDESDTGSVRVGTNVSFQVDAFPTELFRGRVSVVRLNATTVQNVVTYNTVVDFDNPGEKLLPGETAYVTIPTGHVTGVILIPNGALTFTPAISRVQLQALYSKYSISRQASASHLSGWQVVWEQGPKDNPYIPVAVQCGITDYINTQMVSGDLKEGDVVITGEQTALGAGRGAGGAGGRGIGGGFGGPGR
jgi:HlyD family secretion protein